jgi:DNA-binding IclR family transcriptional regulator
VTHDEAASVLALFGRGAHNVNDLWNRSGMSLGRLYRVLDHLAAEGKVKLMRHGYVLSAAALAAQAH